MSPPKLAPRTRKRCPDCNVVKPNDQFYRNRSSSDGLQGYCKMCWDARAKRRNEKKFGKGYHRASHLKKTYGISLDQYNEMLPQSDGKCWACGEVEIATHPKTGTLFALAVDHDHETGEVRGLLCFKCNTTIRSVGDDRERLLRLAEYLASGSPVG